MLASEKPKGILRQKEKLVKKIENLADYCGLSNRRFLPRAFLIKTVSRFSCEKRIMYIISNNADGGENAKFDPYYRQKSAFTTIKILDHIKTALSAIGQEATILTEVSADYARYDAVVVPGRLGEVNPLDSRNVRIEIKASLGLDLEQLSRYLWSPSPLILVRVITRHVTKIRPSEIQPYVSFSLEELSSKVDRLLSQKGYTVPGTDCADCPNIECPHWVERSRKRRTNVVTLPDIEFREDLTLFYRNLSYVAERTALLVIEELKVFSSARKQTEEAVPHLKLNQFEQQKTELEIHGRK